MSQYTIKLKLTPYLAEWFVHEHGGCSPVNLIKGSSESLILQNFIRQRPYDAVEEQDPNVTIFVPTFKTIDVRTYNYLPPRATEVLKSTIANNFKINLWTEMHQLRNVNADIGLLIHAYMEKHHISGVYGDTNWESIRQTYYRMRKLYNKSRNESLG